MSESDIMAMSTAGEFPRKQTHLNHGGFPRTFETGMFKFNVLFEFAHKRQFDTHAVECKV